MPKHIARLLVLIAVFVVLAVAAKQFFTADSFYQYGHYRGAAVAEIASKVPKLQGSASCESCHKEVYAEWKSGIHRKATKNDAVRGLVIKYGPNCEVCHNGPAGNHPSKEAMPISVEDQITTITHLERTVHPANIPGKSLLVTGEDMRGICLNCHEKIMGRPLEQRQVAVDGHSGKELCTTCHNPHSPRIDFAKIPRVVAAAGGGKAVAASQESASADASAGQVAAAACFACHGNNGKSVNPEWPNLAGQHANYLVDSLKAFKSKTRVNDMMSPMAAGLSDADIRNVSAFFAKSSCSATGGDKTKAALGKTKADEAGCAACHSAGGLHGTGAAGISASPSWPNLAGQNASYLTVALKAFKSGGRNHPVMSSIAKTLNDSDIDNVSAYYASVICK